MSREIEIEKIQYENEHHKEIEETKKYKTIEFDLIPVIFKEKYEITENYKKCEDTTPKIDHFFSEYCSDIDYDSYYQTNINKYYCRPISDSSFLYYHDSKKEEITKIFKILKEILKDILCLNNYASIGCCGFVESIILKKNKHGNCIFTCNIKISEVYFSKKAQKITKNKIVCKKLLEKGFEEKNFSNYFNYIDDYFNCLLEITFGSCSGKIVIGPCSYFYYTKNSKSIKAYDQIEYMQNLILLKKYKYHHETIYKNKEKRENIYLVLKKLGFIFRNDKRKKKKKNIKVNSE